MKKNKQKKLEAAGWRVGSAKDFLRMSDEEAALVRLKIALADAVRAQRSKAGLTQLQLAKKLGSSQSRIAKLEAGDGSVSTELAIRALFALGTTHKALGRVIGRADAA